MKTIKLTIIILLTIAVLSIIKSGRSFNIVQALPFADGKPVNIYHWAALAILLITCWGYCRLNHKKKEEEPKEDDEDDYSHYENDEENNNDSE
ncbi:MAG: hypothetical protein WC770_04555 [Phycisphaerae bacterium]|jgi:hypothetical protein